MSAVKNGALARFSRIALGAWRVLEWKMRPTELAAYLLSCQEAGITTREIASAVGISPAGVSRICAHPKAAGLDDPMFAGKAQDGDTEETT